MLKKLLRHELIETWKIPAIALSTAVLLTLVCSLYFYFMPFPDADVEMNVGVFAIFMGYTVIVSSISVLIVVYLGVRFYKNLYTDEGYLMHTLPVRPWMLIISKMLIGLLWSYLACIITVVTVLPATILAIPKMTYMDSSDIAAILPALTGILGGNVSGMLFFFLPYMLVSCASSVLFLYAAISLGQLFGGHKVLASILCYLGLQTLISIASSLFVAPGLAGVIVRHADDSTEFLNLVMPSIMRTIYISSFFADIVLAAAAFYLTYYIMKKCLNLD